MTLAIRDIRNPEGRVVGAGIFPAGAMPAGLELYRAAYAGDGAELTGLQVLDEFETMSGPVIVCPVTSLGEAYDAALTLAFARSADLEIGSGWPPVAIGLDATIPIDASGLARATVLDVDVVLAGGALQAVAVVVTSRNVNAAALRRAADAVRALLTPALSLVVAISTAQPATGGGRWTADFDRSVRQAYDAARRAGQPADPDPGRSS